MSLNKPTACLLLVKTSRTKENAFKYGTVIDYRVRTIWKAATFLLGSIFQATSIDNGFCSALEGWKIPAVP